MSRIQRCLVASRASARLVALAFAIAYTSASAAEPKGIDRDWNKHPAIAIEPARKEIYALGDVHGDYDRMIRVLAAAHLIEAQPQAPEKVKWAAGDAVLVCNGDLIDKGTNALPVIAALRALTNGAERSGGRVIVTMGNHEAEFLADPDNTEKGGEFIAELKTSGMKPRDVAEGKDQLGIGKFLRSLPFCARVNDWFFAHAGNTKGMSIEELATALKEGVDNDGFGAEILSKKDSLLEARLKDPLWWEQPNDASGQGEARLRQYVQALGAHHLVIGHQPEAVVLPDGTNRKKGEMVPAFDGLLFLIDVGMSQAINHNPGAVLRIHGHDPVRATRIDFDGSTTRIWTETP